MPITFPGTVIPIATEPTYIAAESSPGGEKSTGVIDPNTPVKWADLTPELQRQIGQQVVSMVFDPVKEIQKGFG